MGVYRHKQPYCGNCIEISAWKLSHLLTSLYLHANLLFYSRLFFRDTKQPLVDKNNIRDIHASIGQTYVVALYFLFISNVSKVCEFISSACLFW